MHATPEIEVDEAIEAVEIQATVRREWRRGDWKDTARTFVESRRRHRRTQPSRPCMRS